MATAIVVAVGVLLLILMWRGWRGRVRRTGAGLAALPTPWPAELPASGSEPPGSEPLGSEPLVVEATYVSTTTAGDWLDRIAAAGLGLRSRALVQVDPRGVLIQRQGADTLALPAADLVVARRERAIAGKVVEPGGIVVMRWRLGDRELDTGVRPRYERDRDALVQAVQELVAAQPNANANAGANRTPPAPPPLIPAPAEAASPAVVAPETTSSHEQKDPTA